jgi:hypothetical protein
LYLLPSSVLIFLTILTYLLLLSGEIPGACSNRNYAARAAVKYMIKTGLLEIHPVTKEVDLDFTTCTVCDSDTTFYYKYFENLTW